MSVYESLFSVKARPASLPARACNLEIRDCEPHPRPDTQGTVPCFTEGTLIRTPDNDVPIETLKIGDQVMTKDRGAQTLRWIGRTVKPVDPVSAPVVFAKGALGNDRQLILSPDHRVLLSGWRCAAVAGTREILAAAKDLVNGRDITSFGGETITYLHLAFDQHEIVSTAGLYSESFHPEAVARSAMSDRTRAAIISHFPDVGANPNNYGALVRPQVRAYEARLIRP